MKIEPLTVFIFHKQVSATSALLAKIGKQGLFPPHRQPHWNFCQLEPIFTIVGQLSIIA